MCLGPELALALGASAAGSGINAYETNRTQGNMADARNAATMAELQRQKGYGKTSRDIYHDSAANFSAKSQEHALGSAQRDTKDAYRANAPIDVGSVSSGNGPRVVQDAAKSTVADAFTRNNAQNDALGQLKGWDQRAFNNNVALDNSGRNLDINTDLSKTSAGVGKLEADAAYRNAYKPNSGIGDLLKLAGSVGAYSAGKGGTFGDLFSGFGAKSVPGVTPAFNPNNMNPAYWGAGVPGAYAY